MLGEVENSHEFYDPVVVYMEQFCHDRCIVEFSKGCHDLVAIDVEKIHSVNGWLWI